MTIDGKELTNSYTYAKYDFSGSSIPDVYGGFNLSLIHIFYQVKLEAGEQAQKVIDDVLKLSVVNSKGEMVPFSSFTQIEQKLGMDQINRYNMYSAASITCIVIRTVILQGLLRIAKICITA